MIILIQADLFSEINLAKDDTFYIAKTAVNRNHSVFWTTALLMLSANDTVMCNLFNGEFLEESIKLSLSSIDILLIRQNPPVDEIYIENINYLSILCKKFSILAINSPHNLNNFLEKKLPLIICPELTPRTIFIDNIDRDKINFFLYSKLFDKNHYIIKPSNFFGGKGIHKLKKTGNIDSDIAQILKFLQSDFIIQEFLDEIKNGDRRVSIVTGELISSFVRMPVNGYLANIAQGAIVQKDDFNKDEIFLYKSIARKIFKYGIIYAGIDIIGSKIIEINTTSPCGLKIYDKIFNSKFAVEKFWQKIEYYKHTNNYQ